MLFSVPLVVILTIVPATRHLPYTICLGACADRPVSFVPKFPLVALMPLLVSIPMPAETRVPIAVTTAYWRAIEVPANAPDVKMAGRVAPKAPAVAIVRAVTAAAIKAVFIALAIYAKNLCSVTSAYYGNPII